MEINKPRGYRSDGDGVWRDGGRTAEAWDIIVKILAVLSCDPRAVLPVVHTLNDHKGGLNIFVVGGNGEGRRLLKNVAQLVWEEVYCESLLEMFDYDPADSRCKTPSWDQRLYDPDRVGWDMRRLSLAAQKQ